MFVGDRFVYVEIHKTGCTKIRELLLDQIGGVLAGKHEFITHHQGALPVIGSIRNPWTWYVSLWGYGCGGAGGVYAAATGTFSWLDRILPWRAASRRRRRWSQTYSDCLHAGNFRRWLAMVHDPKSRMEIDPLYGTSSIADFAGLLTFRHVLYSTPWNELQARERKGGFSGMADLLEFLEEHQVWVDAIRLESIGPDIIRVLQGQGYSLSEEQQQEILAKAQVRNNRSLHQEPAYYYDGPTEDLVAQRDSLVVEKYGYTFPGQAGPGCPGQ